MPLSPTDVRALRYAPTTTPQNGAVYAPPIRVPSVRALARIEWLEKLHNDPTDVARAVRRYLRGAALDPANYGPQGFRGLDAAKVLRALDPLLETFGVETLALDANDCGPRSMPRAFYLNTGDTYAATLAFYVPTRTWRVTSWGDIVEGDERRGVKYA